MKFFKSIFSFLGEKKEVKKKVSSKKFDKSFEVITGYYNAGNSQKIKNIIRRLMEIHKFNSCYIGATDYLYERWSGYSKWKCKQVIYESSSIDEVKKAEEDLIKYITNKGWVCNLRPDSVGLDKKSNYFYLYVLADVECRILKDTPPT